MTLHGPIVYLLLAACMTSVPTSLAQSDPSTDSRLSNPMEHRIDLLLEGQSEALDHYQQKVAPAIRCDYADENVRQTCGDMLAKIRDEAQQAKQHISLYRTSSARRPVDLFDIYVDLKSVLEDIEILAIEDEFNGKRNHAALAAGYNSFIKVTGVWFTGEMRETIRNLSP